MPWQTEQQAFATNCEIKVVDHDFDLRDVNIDFVKNILKFDLNENSAFSGIAWIRSLVEDTEKRPVIRIKTYNNDHSGSGNFTFSGLTLTGCSTNFHHDNHPNRNGIYSAEMPLVYKIQFVFGDWDFATVKSY